jgi:heat shock protein HslJ
MTGVWTVRIAVAALALTLLSACTSDAESGLEGTSWTATGISNNNQAVASSATVTTITTEFGNDDSLSGFGGCNNYTSTWTTTGPDGLTIGPVGSQLKACQQDVMDTEQQYFAALAKVATYQLEGNELTLRDSQGAVQVSFVPTAD